MEYCQLRKTTTQNILDNTDLELVWDAQDWISSAGMFSAGTPSRLFLSKGVWDVRFGIAFPYNASINVRQARLYTGPVNTLIRTVNNSWATSGQVTMVSYATDLYITADNAYMYVVALHRLGSTLTLPASVSFLSAVQVKVGWP